MPLFIWFVWLVSWLAQCHSYNIHISLFFLLENFCSFVAHSALSVSGCPKASARQLTRGLFGILCLSGISSSVHLLVSFFSHLLDFFNQPHWFCPCSCAFSRSFVPLCRRLCWIWNWFLNLWYFTMLLRTPHRDISRHECLAQITSDGILIWSTELRSYSGSRCMHRHWSSIFHNLFRCPLGWIGFYSFCSCWNCWFVVWLIFCIFWFCDWPCAWIFNTLLNALQWNCDFWLLNS